MANWIIQENFGSRSNTFERLSAACQESGYEVHGVRCIPFSLELPEMPDVEAPFVLYGGTTLILNAANDTKWRSGVFYDPETFTPEAYQNNYGDAYLNSDSRVVSTSEFAQEEHERHHCFFLRPNDDLKQFAGEVMSFGKYKDWYRGIAQAYSTSGKHDDPLNHDTFIVVSSPKSIDQEFRVFIVDGKAVSVSRYKPDTNYIAVLEHEVIEFAEQHAAKWTPAPIFVMDVALCPESFCDRYKIIECNCFNGSGFYDADLNSIVRSISIYLSKST